MENVLYTALPTHRLQSLELVGSRVYVLDAVQRSLVGAAGVVTAASKNCLYLAVDPALVPVPATVTKDGRPRIPPPPPRTAWPADKALQLVREQCVLGVVLPNKGASSGDRGRGLFRDSSSTGAALASTEGEGSAEEGTSGIGQAPTGAVQAYDHHEYRGVNGNENGDSRGRLCVLYGKHYLPHCSSSS